MWGGDVWHETGRRVKQAQAWDWSRAEPQGQERCSSQSWFQKSRDLSMLGLEG